MTNGLHSNASPTAQGDELATIKMDSSPSASGSAGGERLMKGPEKNGFHIMAHDSNSGWTRFRDEENRSPIRDGHIENLGLEHSSTSNTEYRLYKRRFIGLAQLVLLNIIVSWDWLTFAAITTTASKFFNKTQVDVTWLSTAFLFAFLPASPVAAWVLNKYGPKMSIIVASALVLVGNWVRYGAVRANPPSFAAAMVGQILIGFSQPFVLAAPTRYSNLWFSDTGRISATAVASLANPFGGALGELVGPLWATKVSEVPNMILYVAIISSVATIPAPFIPKEPPSPPSQFAASEKAELRKALRLLVKNQSFWIILLPFSVYVGFFNAVSSLVNQILEPYGFSELDAGVGGGLLIIVGLVASAVVSPIIDRYGHHAIWIKVLVPPIAVCYLVFIFMPATRTIAGPWTVLSLLGATSFSLLPCALEYMVLVTYPVTPEITSAIAWSGGQLFGALFIVIMNALQGGWSGEPRKAMTRALVFEAVIAIAAVPFVYFLGVGSRKKDGVFGQEERTQADGE